LLNKEEEYLKEQVYSLWDTEHAFKKTERAYNYFGNLHSKKTPEHQQYVLLKAESARLAHIVFRI
jgi:hypothetical protein